MTDTPDTNNKGFSSGVLMGAIIGAAAVYVMASPEGKKKAKHLLEEGHKLAEKLEKKMVDVKEIVQEASAHPDKKTTLESVTSQLKKKFFKKKGRSLSNLW